MSNRTPDNSSINKNRTIHNPNNKPVTDPTGELFGKHIKNEETENKRLIKEIEIDGISDSEEDDDIFYSCEEGETSDIDDDDWLKDMGKDEAIEGEEIKWLPKTLNLINEEVQKVWDDGYETTVAAVEKEDHKVLKGILLKQSNYSA